MSAAEFFALRSVVNEFIDDIQAVGVANVATDWPDLLAIYRKALRVTGRTDADLDALDDDANA